MQELCDRALVAELPKQREAVLVRRRACGIPSEVRGTAHDAKRPRPQAGRNVTGTLEQLGDSLGSLRLRVRDPEVLEPDRQLESKLRVVRLGPVESRAEVVTLRQPDRQIEGLVVVLREMRRLGRTASIRSA